MKGHGPTKILVEIVQPRPLSKPEQDDLSKQEEHDKLLEQQRAVDRENETDRVRAIFANLSMEIIGELETIARQYKVIGKTKFFPKHRKKELQEKIAREMFDWAVRKMGSDLNGYMEEARLIFMDHFDFNLDPYRSEFIPSYKSLYWSSFEKARFLIPRKAGRRNVHHSKLVEAYVRYKKIESRIKQIPLATRNDMLSYVWELKHRLPGVRDTRLKKWVDEKKKPSDIAAAYVCWDLKLGIGDQALKEYLKVFHTYDGYRGLVLANLKKVFESNN